VGHDPHDAATVALLQRLRPDTMPVPRPGGSPFDFDPAGLAGRAVPSKLAAALQAARPGWPAGAGSTFAAFFAGGCHPCHDRAPGFAALHRRAGQETAVLAMLTRGDGSADRELLDLLGDTPVVEGPGAGTVCSTIARPLLARRPRLAGSHPNRMFRSYADRAARGSPAVATTPVVTAPCSHSPPAASP
jgi:hypothetical protein